MERRKARERKELMLGMLGAVALLIGMFQGLHWLDDWLSAEPVRWLIAAALVAGWVWLWLVIGLCSAFLAALLAR